MASKIYNGTCSNCGDTFGCDKKGLKSSTYIINGVEVVLCIPCEDDTLKVLLTSRGHKDLWKTIKEREK